MSDGGIWLQKSSIIDLRSDTISQPTPQMRKSMSRAELGDDVFGEDPTVNSLEKEVAVITGKEASLFVPSGTMANLIAELVWCDEKGSEMILGDQSHMFLWEQSNGAQFGGISYRTLPNLSDGTIDLEQITKSIRKKGDSFSKTKLISIENTHNQCGGRVLTPEYTKSVAEIGKKHGVKLHLDGARVWNSAAYLGVPVSELTSCVDSLSVCFSKGLGAPAGSAVCGDKEFIGKARRIRKALGGGMRQSGILASGAREGLKRMLPRLHEDHIQAKALAYGISNLNMPEFFICNAEDVETNIVMVEIGPGLIKRNLNSQDVVNRLKNKGLLGVAITDTTIRFVTYYQITPNDIIKAINILRKFLKNVTEEIYTEFSSDFSPQFESLIIPDLAGDPSEDATEKKTATHDDISENDSKKKPEISEENSRLISEENENKFAHNNYQEMEIIGMGASSMGFITVLANESKVLVVPITPSDPMSTGLDTTEPGTPEALTLLQLMQGIDMDFYLPIETLATRMKTRTAELKAVYFHEVDRKKGGASISLLGVTHSDESSTEAKEKFLESPLKSGFEGIALALRYPESKIFVNPNLLENGDDDGERYFYSTKEIEEIFPNLVYLSDAKHREKKSDELSCDAVEAMPVVA